MKNAAKMWVVTLFLLFWSPAHAACRVAATGLNFGAYDVFAPAPLDTTGSVTVTCDQRRGIDVTVSIGPSPTSGGFNPRQMRRTSGTNRLNYNLYTSPSMSTVWGNGSAGTSTVLLRRVRRRRPAVTTIYGRIPPRQNVSVGSYTETLTVTITP
ncbi:MAG TPA: spore coat U domain-containing protein [Candidatus Methylomirabilis sp.]|nr:spore coat U domain-containing protein [Candidatus Methylomirabilis sp.]